MSPLSETESGAPVAHGRERPARVERTVYLMGTVARFVAEAPDRETGLLRLERMVRIVEATEAELSTWRDDSVLSALNRQAVGVPRPVPAVTCDLFRRLTTWHAATGGTFDPAVGRLVDAWGLRRSGASPGIASPEQAPAGFHRLELDRARCTVTRRAPVTLDAGAFGKGEALDRVRRADTGAEGAWLIDFGGQVAVSGPAADGPWPVALAHPERRAEAAARLRLGGGSLATSGPSARDVRLDDGGRLGHILDPHSGRPVARSAPVTVWHEQAFVADVLSTALYVMGADTGLAWAGARDLAAAYLIADAAGGGVRVRATQAFEERFGRRR
ncbi:MAG: FAD:protein FMN transferase [Acidobacteria bacterium]|nr:FAD:protein FMN transferase [Acidobacteriota bacterium]